MVKSVKILIDFKSYMYLINYLFFKFDRVIISSAELKGSSRAS